MSENPAAPPRDEPSAVGRAERAGEKGRFPISPRRFRRAAQELWHRGDGVGGGAVFASLPRALRRQACRGPLHGLGIRPGSQAAVAPAPGLEQARNVRPVDRAAPTAEHLLNGLVPSGLRRRPRR